MRRRSLILIGVLSCAALGLTIVVAAFLLLSRGEMRFLPRASNGEAYVLYVHAPPACTRASPCPALYILDGERWLPTFRRISAEHRRSGTMPPVVLVGIGYRNAPATPQRRKFDFTPKFDRPAPGRATGGADAYLQVLRRDIIPYAEEHYPIDRSWRGLAGHSYGGLFATYALACAPDLFQGYLIMSPALWFDGYKIFHVAAEAPPNLRAHVVLAAEGAPPDFMARDVIRLAAQFWNGAQPPPAQAITLAGKTHSGVVAPAVRAGLPILFTSSDRGDRQGQPRAQRGDTRSCRFDA